MTTYRMIITTIWWGFGLGIIMMFVWVTMNSANFGAHSDAAIDWLLPHLIPTMTLTGAVAYATPARKDARISSQTRFAFVLACVISVFYLGLVAAVILHALTGGAGVETPRGAIDTLTGWNKVLGVLQGLAASAIGVFFVRH